MPASNSDYYSRMQKDKRQRNSHQSRTPQNLHNPYFQRYNHGHEIAESTPYNQIQDNHRKRESQFASSALSDTTQTYVDYQLDDLSIDNTKKPRHMKILPEKIMEESYDGSHRSSARRKLAKKHAQIKADLERISALESGVEQLKNEKRWFSFFFSKDVPPIPTEDERQPYPWLSAPLYSQLVFMWLWPIIKKGYKRTLVPDDLWYLPEELTVQDMHKRFRENLESVLRKDRAKKLRKMQKARHGSVDHLDTHKYQWPMYAIPYALFLTFKWKYSLLCFFLACSFACQACAPLITRRIIDYVTYSYYGVENSVKNGVGYTIGAVVLIFINGMLLNHFFHNAMVVGAATKAILTKDVMLKSFKLLAKLKHKFNTGRITSLMTTDLSRIDLAIGFQPLVLCFPIPVVIAVALLLHNIGVTSLAGIGLFILSLVVCVLLTSKLYSLREKVVKFTDERISLMREVLNNLKVIKFYAWEDAYKENITQVRRREMLFIFQIDVLRNFITAYAVTLPTLTSMVSFVTMWALDNMKAPGQVFSSLSLFSILAQAIMLLPIALATGADAAIGFRRCKDFLGSSEFDEELEEKLNVSEDQYYTKASSSPASTFEFTKRDGSFDEKAPVIDIAHADFVWQNFHKNNHDDLDPLWKDLDKKAKERKMNNFETTGKQSDHLKEASSYASDLDLFLTLSLVQDTKLFRGLFDVNLTVNKGDFVVITGVIGLGKSSLLSAIAGVMQLQNPATAKFDVCSDLLLCGAPWIQNATVRENITFGNPFEPKRYQNIIEACCLGDDLKVLSHGDMTEIGEKGVTLSGGQKARINLARAVYNDASILLFDDVLSAVDSRVGKHIINNLFGDLLRNHTRILATHQLSLVSSADKIVFLNGDGTMDCGTASDLIRRNNAFRNLVQHSEEATEENENEDNVSDEVVPSKAEVSRNLCLLPGSAPVHVTARRGEREGRKIAKEEPKNAIEQFGKTIEDEDVSVNAVSWDVYKRFLQLGSGIFGIFAAPIFLLLVALSTFCQLFTNTWLSFWMERKFDNVLDKLYVTLYVVFAVLTVFFTGIQFTMLGYMNNRSAKMLNVKAVEKILHVPMSFMDTNPLGRVLNRFTKDTDSLDNQLGEQIRLFMFPFATIIGIIILCCCYLPWFLIAVPFLVFVFVFFSSLYSGSSREIKRLEAVQRSVVYNNFNEVLSGMTVIKAYKAESRFIEKNDYLLNRMNEAYFLSIANQRWLCVYLDIIAATFALLISLLCVTNQFNISASSTGLLLNYVIQIVGLLSLTVRAMTQVENEMNSVERLHSYAFSLPQEAPYQKSETKPPKEWPIAGYIQFNDVSMRYRDNLPLVLKNLNFGVYPGEKLGICGRTGAGKSSIMGGLYRLNELKSGSITIDGLDISQMGLHDLRSKLSIIPQDPVLFQGSIRKNLDPFKQFSDELLWDAIRRSGLIDLDILPKIKSTSLQGNNYEMLHKYHLDQVVDDDGGNFSLGEKQLIALARSLVRDTKILILDEATSSVDYETDEKIQKTIGLEFNRSTILCIAHRLRTILNYDRILVMDQGQVVEKGTPWTLYRQNGLFKNMCDKAHISADDFIKPGQ